MFMAAAAQCIAHSREQIRLDARILAIGHRGDERLHGGCRAGRVDQRDPLGDESPHQANLAIGRQAQPTVRLLCNRRLDPVPDHERQIVVGGVFVVCQQTGRDRPALVRRHSLEGRRKVEPDERGWIVFRHPREFAPRRL